MLKFLRKYQAWIMAVGGSLLMIAFLLPQAIQRFGNMARNKPVFRISVDGSTRSIETMEWQKASSELAILEAMFNTRDIGPLLNFPEHDEADSKSGGLQGADHWILLKREAELAGLLGGVGDGDRQLMEQAANFAAQQRLEVDEVYQRLIQILRSEAGQASMSLDDGKRAFAALAGIGRLIDLYAGAPPASDNRVRHIFDKFEDKVNVALVFVDAADHIADLPEPDEALLTEQFEKYKHVAPGEGEKGFGYRLPDRAQVEYLTIDYDSVIDQVQASGLEARKWFQRNADQARANPDGSQPTFDEVADEAIDAYRRSKAEELLTEISRYIKGELLKNVQPLAHEGGYRVLPEDWAQKRVSFEKLRDEIQQQFGVDVEYHADTTKWYTMSELSQLEGIGGAVRPAGVTNMSFGQLVQAHRELGKSNVPGLQAGLADFLLLRSNVYNTSRVGPTAYPGDAFLYRVLDIDLARAPETLAEVRDQVAKDVKRQQAFEQLKANLDTWRQRGIDETLEELAKSIDTTVRRGSIARYGNFNSKPGDFAPNGVGSVNSPTMVAAVFDRVETFEPLTRVNDLPMEQRLLATPVPEQLGLALVRLESHFPPTRQAWLRALDTGMRISGLAPGPISPTKVLMDRTFADEQMEPFTFESMKRRFDYVDERPESEREPAADGVAPSEGEPESSSEEAGG
ncbi:MAG: hypothetical protein IT430_00590 [Phycisphaerales bacterium]|nr:hypothetical protein [Phycisphaerales bacterium]